MDGQTYQQPHDVKNCADQVLATSTEAEVELSAQALLEMNASVRTTFEQAVQSQLDHYFAQLDGRDPMPLYELVIQAVERPLLSYVMAMCRDNQCAAAKLLGINRNTLRSKLIKLGLLQLKSERFQVNEVKKNAKASSFKRFR